MLSSCWKSLVSSTFRTHYFTNFLVKTIIWNRFKTKAAEEKKNSALTFTRNIVKPNMCTADLRLTRLWKNSGTTWRPAELWDRGVLFKQKTFVLKCLKTCLSCIIQQHMNYTPQMNSCVYVIQTWSKSCLSDLCEFNRIQSEESVRFHWIQCFWSTTRQCQNLTLQLSFTDWYHTFRVKTHTRPTFGSGLVLTLFGLALAIVQFKNTLFRIIKQFSSCFFFVVQEKWENVKLTTFYLSLLNIFFICSRFKTLRLMKPETLVFYISSCFQTAFRIRSESSVNGFKYSTFSSSLRPHSRLYCGLPGFSTNLV